MLIFFLFQHFGALCKNVTSSHEKLTTLTTRCQIPQGSVRSETLLDLTLKEIVDLCLKSAFP